MNFDLNITSYESTRERLKTRKINDIVTKMKKLLIFNRHQLKKTKKLIEN